MSIFDGFMFELFNFNRVIEKTDYSLDDVYRYLSFFSKSKENLQVWLYDKIKENYGRELSY